MRATGKLVYPNPRAEFLEIGDPVTIDLPRNVRAIGICTECDWYVVDRNFEAVECGHIGLPNDLPTRLKFKGCGCFKPKKGAI